MSSDIAFVFPPETNKKSLCQLAVVWLGAEVVLSRMSGHGTGQFDVCSLPALSFRAFNAFGDENGYPDTLRVSCVTAIGQVSFSLMERMSEYKSPGIFFPSTPLWLSLSFRLAKHFGGKVIDCVSDDELLSVSGAERIKDLDLCIEDLGMGDTLTKMDVLSPEEMLSCRHLSRYPDGDAKTSFSDLTQALAAKMIARAGYRESEARAPPKTL